MSTLNRPQIEQSFFAQPITVGTVPTQFLQGTSLPAMIQAILISNYSSNTNSVFFGDQNISAIAPLNGVEFTAGNTYFIAIEQVRQLYEVQNLDLITAQATAITAGSCDQVTPDAIPVIVWNPQNMYLVASASTTVGAIFFRNVYV